MVLEVKPSSLVFSCLHAFAEVARSSKILDVVDVLIDMRWVLTMKHGWGDMHRMGCTNPKTDG
jgi:hypothetical protein